MWTDEAFAVAAVATFAAVVIVVIFLITSN